MERAVAVKKLGKLLGKSFGYRVNDKAATREERAEALEALKLAREERQKLKNKMDERRAILLQDVEYQRLCMAHKAAVEHVSQLASIARHYKITVGTTNSLFFHVKAEGDSWEEVIDKISAAK